MLEQVAGTADHRAQIWCAVEVDVGISQLVGGPADGSGAIGDAHDVRPVDKTRFLQIGLTLGPRSEQERFGILVLAGIVGEDAQQVLGIRLQDW